MASEKDVLRALVEEARSSGAHPDRQRIFDEFAEAQSDSEPEQNPDEQNPDESDDQQESRAARPGPARTRGQR